MIKKPRINVILPKNVSNAMRERMLKDGYGLREKSRWVNEAIESLLELKDFHNHVELAGLVDDLTNLETIYITSALEDKLEDAVLRVRKKYPVLEGVKSLIVRASIIRRLVLISTPKIPVTGL